MVRQGESLSDWLAYYEVYRTTMTYWERPTSAYGELLFRLLHGAGSDRIRLWLVEVEGVVIAGAIVLTTGVHAVHWSGAAIRGTAPGATNLLHWEVLGSLAEEGFALCDLNPSGGHDGVVAFKEAIGAEPMPAPLVVRRDWRERGIETVRRVLSKAAK